MVETIKKRIRLENLMCLFIIICPILDIMSFIFRNYFNTTFSPSTILRPIIPCICFIILFFQEKNKKQKIIIALIYAIYSALHLALFQKLHNGSSYGTLANEMQYIINYSFLIIDLYLFYKIIKDNDKLHKSIFISLTIYIVTLFISILTKTSSSTYIEGIGYKGYFESGNSLCTVLVLSICIILSSIKLKEWKKVILIAFAGLYLCAFSGMRTGLFGFGIILAIYILAKIFFGIKNNIKLNKKQIVIVTVAIILAIIFVIIFGMKSLERRKMLKQNEQLGIDSETGEQRYVTGDILNLYKQIQGGNIEKSYMTEAERNAIIKLCEYAKEHKLSNVNLRKQQFIYNVFLVKEQKDFKLILFGNGYKNQTGELVMEMEIPAMLLNFGIFGFLLYFGPFLGILIYSIYKGIKYRKNIDTEYVMYLAGTGLAVALSCLSGYVYFNFSSMTIAIILNVLLLQKSNKIQDR